MQTQLLEGLKVSLDRLIYDGNATNLPAETPHAFIYFITIKNLSDKTVTLLGRKWVIKDEFGKVIVIEGDKIVGKTPILQPGESFSYNSYHLTQGSAVSTGAYYGVDETNRSVHTVIPTFSMIVPSTN